MLFYLVVYIIQWQFETQICLHYCRESFFYLLMMKQHVRQVSSQVLLLNFTLGKLWYVIPQVLQNRPRRRCFSSFSEYFFQIYKGRTAFSSKHSSWWTRLEDTFCLRLQITSSRCLDQDEYIRLSHTSSEDVFKTS